MAPKFESLMYEIYASRNGIEALVCFPVRDIEWILPFRDSLTELIQRSTGLLVLRAQGRPMPPDSIFRFYDKKDETAIEEYVQAKSPGIFSRILNSAEWKSYRERETKQREAIKVEIETSHDFPCIVIQARSLLERFLAGLIEDAARDSNIQIRRNRELDPIRDVVTSNRTYG